MSKDDRDEKIKELEDQVAFLEGENSSLENELAEAREEFDDALRALRLRRYLAMLDELERVLPSEFVGLADDIIKWAGKTR